MANINVELKGPKGPQEKESLLAISTVGYTRGLLVISGYLNGSDEFHVSLPTAAGQRCVGAIEEDQVVAVGSTVPMMPLSIIQRGQTVLQIGATVTPGIPLTNNALGQAIPAGPGQPVAAVALSGNPNAGDYITATMTPPSSTMLGDAPLHSIASGVIAVQTGAVGIGLGGVAALAMTLAAPTAAQDGTNIFFTAESSFAHTITTPANGINGSKHIITFAARGDYAELEAMSGTWAVRGTGAGAVIT